MRENLDNLQEFNDVQYHEPADVIEAKNPPGSWIINKGKVEYVPWTKIPSTFTYSFKKKRFYVPSYIDSVLFSKMEQVPISSGGKETSLLFF